MTSTRHIRILAIILGTAAFFALGLTSNTAMAAAAKPADVSQSCYDNFTKAGTEAGCTPAELASMDRANGVATPNDSITSQGQAAQVAKAVNHGKPAPKVGEQCSLLAAGSWFSECIWKPLMSWLGSWFLTVGGFALYLAGTVFDTLIYHVIVDFKSTLEALNITKAIDAGWTVFRDFTNILIIGLFVFIAISIILGLHEFGEKRLIANVLIVAILINFSLLFTKIIIDASNFTAYVIYRQMAGASAPNGQIKFDIAGKYMEPMGMTSVWDTYSLTSGVANARNADGTTNGAMAGFIFGLVGGIMLFVLAAVIGYGCFIIASRAILFIFLMLTAALAFATYLIPSLSKGEYGWSNWWKTLFNNAIFAPLLMLFLAVSYAIIQQAGTLSGGQAQKTIGSVIADPASQLTTNAWTVVLIYIIGTGLLFISFKMASKFAGTISGFSMAGALPALGIAAGARLAGGLGGFLGRQTLGRGALALSDRMQTASKEEGRSALSRQLYDFGAQRFKGVAQRDFNAMQGAIGKGIASGVGLRADQLAGDKIGGFLGKQEKIAHDIADRAKRMTLNKEERKAQTEATVDAVIQGSEELTRRHQEATQLHETAQTGHAEAEKQLAHIAEQHEETMRQLQGELAQTRSQVQRGTRFAEDVEAVQQRMARTRAEHASAMDQQAQRIRDAKEAVSAAERGVSRIRGEAQAIAKGKDLIPEPQSAHTLAEIVAEDRWLGTKGQNHRLAHLAQHHLETEGKKKKLSDFIADATDRAEAQQPQAQGHADAEAAGDQGGQPAAGGAAPHA